MFARPIILGFAALALAVPAAAQSRGTVEFGFYGTRMQFADALLINDSWGAGGRIGAFLYPRLSAEFEVDAANASRPEGLNGRSVRFLNARLTAVPIKVGRLSILAGIGANHTDVHVHSTVDNQSYGYHGLLGAKFALNPSVALRADAIQYMQDGKQTNRAFRAGFSIYRQPATIEKEVIRTVAAEPMMHSDSVSAAETRRLREAAARYQALRDSLARPRTPTMNPTSSESALATMQQMIYFERDKSTLSDSAKRILDEKVAVFRANPNMKIVIVGHASSPGSDAYNAALGLRRAEASKAYLVSRGVSADRVEISTKGEGQLAVEGDSDAANAANRRGAFRLLIADPFLQRPE